VSIRGLMELGSVLGRTHVERVAEAVAEEV
jgi:hypothetical protein